MLPKERTWNETALYDKSAENTTNQLTTCSCRSAVWLTKRTDHDSPGHYWALDLITEDGVSQRVIPQRTVYDKTSKRHDNEIHQRTKNVKRPYYNTKHVTLTDNLLRSAELQKQLISSMDITGKQTKWQETTRHFNRGASALRRAEWLLQ